MNILYLVFFWLVECDTGNSFTFFFVISIIFLFFFIIICHLTYVHVTHGGTHGFTSLRHYTTTAPPSPSPPSPPSLAGKKKKNFFFFFCIGGINSRHLDAARNRDFGGSINFKNRSEPLRRTRNGFFPRWEPTCWFCRRDLTQTCEDYSAFYRLHSPLYIWFPF